MTDAEAVAQFEATLTAQQLAEWRALVDADPRMWWPNPGPQEMAATSTADIIGYGGAAGGGKLLKLNEKIVTPTGFTLMGELRQGDEVIDKDGQPCRVTFVSDIDPEPELWRFTFDDGETVDSCVDHQWLTYTAAELSALTRKDPEWRARRREKRPSRASGNRSEAFVKAISERNSRLAVGEVPPEMNARSTREIVDALRLASGRANHAIPVCAAPDCADRDLLIDPYVLGAWLGDGSKAGGGFTGIDPEIWQDIEKAGYEVRHYDAKSHSIIGLKGQLRSLGVLMNKHIPMEYLRASRTQRLALLQGLMDTDGTVATASGSAEFCNTNRAIAEGVRALICSLGWKTSFRESRATLYGKDCGPKWTLKFMATEPVFRLKRKADIQKLSTRRTIKFRYIVDAQPVASEPGRCIQVDSPSRTYLVGDAMIVTHNTDLVCGLSLNEHKRVLVARRQKTQTQGIVQRLEEIIGSTDGYSSQNSHWNVNDVLIEFAGMDNDGDEKKFQGRPHDLIAIDETTEHREAQVRFLLGWCRTNIPGQRCRSLLTFNPPTNAEGRWVIRFFAPWLDPKHHRPAKDGELRWFTSIGDNPDYEVDGPDAFVLVNGKPHYDFDPRQHSAEDIITPKSRTFITARVTDNPFYMATGYIQQLQALPEPLRSQMLKGDFGAGVEDDAWQVIPTAWIEAAMDRHNAKISNPQFVKGPMDSMGVDAARGGNMGSTQGAVGRDKMVIFRRHGRFLDKPVTIKGVNVNNGALAAGQVVQHRRDNAVVHIDVIGVGTSPYDFLQMNGVQTIPVNGAAGSMGTDKSGQLRFTNLRAELHWRMREALDPANPECIDLPDDSELLADLAAPTYTLGPSGIKVESKPDLIKRLKRSPDKGDAAIYSLLSTPKRQIVMGPMIGVSGATPQTYEDTRLRELE